MTRHRGYVEIDHGHRDLCGERRAKKLTSEEHLAMRKEASLSLLDNVFDWCRKRKEKYLPKDPLFLAIQYALNHEAALRVYCTDGRLAIDNNETERMLRLAAIGRRNGMFFGSAKRQGLNEFDYLVDLLDRLSDPSSEAELFEMRPDRRTPQKL